MKGVTPDDAREIQVILVSIHTPNEGSDLVYPGDVPGHLVFQSTLPMKGVTRNAYPRCPLIIVSIHTPNEGSDYANEILWLAITGFNPHSQ